MIDPDHARFLVSRLTPPELTRLRHLDVEALAAEREYFLADLKENADIAPDQRWFLDGWKAQVAAIDRELMRRRCKPGQQTGGVTQAHIDNIKATVSLEQELLDIGVPLRKNGRGKVGLCPLHTEKTPSFHLYPDGHFYCYGCTAHGDIITFTQLYYNMEFIPAVRYLALRAGVNIPRARRNPHTQSRDIMQATPLPPGLV